MFEISTWVLLTEGEGAISKGEGGMVQEGKCFYKGQLD